MRKDMHKKIKPLIPKTHIFRIYDVSDEQPPTINKDIPGKTPRYVVEGNALGDALFPLIMQDKNLKGLNLLKPQDDPNTLIQKSNIELFNINLFFSNFIESYHNDIYPAISLSRCDLSNQNIIGVLNNFDLSNIKMNSGSIQNSYLTNCFLDNSDLSNVSISNNKFIGCSYECTTWPPDIMKNNIFKSFECFELQELLIPIKPYSPSSENT